MDEEILKLNNELGRPSLINHVNIINFFSVDTSQFLSHSGQVTC